MSNRTISAAELQLEARSLRYLLSQYVDDRAFIEADPPGRILYFVDSHELKAYINPEKPEILAGFVTEAERAYFSNDADFDIEAKLKSSRMLRELLFEHRDQVGLLPPHGEEVDEAIAYEAQDWISTKIQLFTKAREQVRLLQASEKWRRYLAAYSSTQVRSEGKRALVELLRENAPALTALLHRTPDDPMSRIKSLAGSDSNLCRLSDIQWDRLGFDQQAVDRLSVLRPDPRRVDAWRRYLQERPERQRNSTRANRLDAEAMAFLQAANATFEAIPGCRVRARLVTRAMTLVSATRDWKGLARANLENADVVRHPRLLALQSREGELPDHGCPEQELIVTLRTYQRQLAALTDEDALDQATVSASAKSLVSAWADFERTRSAVDLHDYNSTVAGASHQTVAADSSFDEILLWFRNSKDVLSLIHQDLFRTVEKFGRATYELSRTGLARPVEAELIRLDNPLRTRLLPLVPGAPGPVDLPSNIAFPEQKRLVDLERAVLDLEWSTAERYLLWSTLFACQARWNLAGIYARSAIELEQAVGAHSHWIADEARLLRAQIRRLGGASTQDPDLDSQDPKRRIEQAAKDLSLIGRRGDARILRERAAQVLEAHLLLSSPNSSGLMSLNEQPGRVPDGLMLLEEAYRSSNADPFVRTSVLELGLIFELALFRHPGVLPDYSGLGWDRAASWHRELREILASQRKSFHPEEISVRARGMEIIGFQLLFDRKQTHRVAAPLSPGLSQPVQVSVRIPADLHLDARDVLEQISQSADATARLLVSELEPIVQKLEQYPPEELIYAPVWTPSAVPNILSLIDHPGAHRMAKHAYAELERITREIPPISFTSKEVSELREIGEEFDKIADLLKTLTPPPREALFYIGMECCYTRMLLARLSPKQRRERGFEALESSYRQIVADYPEASVPRFRLDIILSDLGRESEGFAEAALALQLLENDPFIREQEHWVRSTVRRRLASRFSEEAQKIKQEISGPQTRSDNRERYLEALAKAFNTVYSGFVGAEQPAMTRVYSIERRRRINNIVFYAALLLEAEPDCPRWQEKGFSKELLVSLLQQLQPDGLGKVTERNIVHTIGCAYAALGDFSSAAQAADRLVTILVLTGDNPQNDDVARLLADAFGWKRNERTRFWEDIGADPAMFDHGPPQEAKPDI